MPTSRCMRDCNTNQICECDQRLEKPLFKVGDQVYSLLHGWGMIQSIDDNYIKVAKTMTSPSTTSYYKDGSFIDGVCLLFHDKPTIIPAKKKVKKWKFAYQTGDGGVCSEDYYTEEEAKSWKPQQAVKLPWTEIEE